MSGALERGGRRLIEIEVDLGKDTGPTAVLGRNFNVKYELAPDGSRLPVQLFDPVNQGRFNWQILNFNLPTGYP